MTVVLTMRQKDLPFVFTIIALICSCSTAKGDNSLIHRKEGVPHIDLPNYGPLSGAVLQSRNEKPFYAFKGLRYANPPKRFEPSEVASEKWTNVKAADTFGARCIQSPPWLQGLVVGDEDCLFLNLYVPIEPLEKKTLPVMVWIHGGGYFCGEGDSYGPEYFMDQDVIIVTFNYRLGALGFLNTEDDVVPGNNGIKDQIVALKWVKKNIGFFGGDSNRVTIFGESAGSNAVHHLVLSKMAKDLFHNAICISGSALSSWGVKANPLKSANELGELLGCSTSTSTELVQCLKQKSTREILQKSNELKIWNMDPLIIFGATIEKNTNPDSTLISDAPANVVASGQYNKVPLMVGINEKEGVIQSSPVLKSEQSTKELNKDWDRIAPITFEYKDVFDENVLPVVSKKIRKFYFGDKPVSEETRNNLTELYTDAHFLHGAHRTALLHSKDVPVYLYVYSYSTNFSLNNMDGSPIYYGASHADDLHMYFTTEMFGPKITKDHPSYEFSQNLVKLFVSFAADSKPSKTLPGATWEPVIKSKKPFNWYWIERRAMLLKDPFKERMQFWDNLIQNPLHANDYKDEL